MTSSEIALIRVWQRALAVADHASVPYLATVNQVCLDVGLEPYEPRHSRKRIPWRVIYVSAHFMRWVSNKMPLIVVDPTQPSAAAQLEAELRSFCEGKVLAVSKDFHCLDPLGKAIWELKTPDLRLVGWFPVKNCMILHCGGDANELHRNFANYTPLIEATDLLRAKIGVRLPGPVMGVRASDVVSNRVR